MKRGLGRVYQPSWRDRKTGEKKRSPTWWIAYYHRGKMIRESADSDKRSDAVKLLRKRYEGTGKGKLLPKDVEKTTFEDLAAMLTNDYKANGFKSLNRAEDAVNHLRSFFADYRAVQIESDEVTKYVNKRQEEGAASATINAELSALSRMFKLGMIARKVLEKPHIKKLSLNNVRRGFFEREQFDALLKHVPEHLRAMLETAYITGWRVHSEILTRQRHHVDLRAGWLRPDPGETKNNEGRMFPLTPGLREILEMQIARTEALQKAMGKIIPWLFHRDGQPIKHFRRSWLTACKNAGVPGRIPHDFRRTAVRNLARAGVERTAAMAMVGHKTESIYRRYTIVDEPMLKDAAARLQQLHEAEGISRTSKARAKQS